MIIRHDENDIRTIVARFIVLAGIEKYTKRKCEKYSEHHSAKGLLQDNKAMAGTLVSRKDLRKPSMSKNRIAAEGIH